MTTSIEQMRQQVFFTACEQVENGCSFHKQRNVLTSHRAPKILTTTAINSKFPHSHRPYDGYFIFLLVLI
jgi:hypothetical protein